MNEYTQEQRFHNRELEHDIVLRKRKNLEISGVKEVESFDNEEFLLETVMGYLSVRGKDLHMKNLNVGEGLVSIEGKIDDLIYIDDHGYGKTKGFLGKLFK